jgi:Helix-turn-helix domain
LDVILPLNTVNDTAKILGCSRVTVYEEVNAGLLEAVRHGCRTKIVGESIKRRIASLPRVRERSR